MRSGRSDIKTYYVFIDESGNFSKENDQSVVGGGITSLELKKVREILKKTEKEANAQTDYKRFDINKDMHMAPLLHPNNAQSGTAEEKRRFLKIKSEDRKHFAVACLRSADNIFEKYVFSKNKGFDFGEIDAQERYGVNLIAVMYEALKYLKTKNDATLINVYIAPRSTKCLPDKSDYIEYHQKMTQHLKACFAGFLPKQKSINISFNKNGKRKSGLDLADIACYFFKQKHNSVLNKCLVTQPNKFTAESMNKASDNILKSLLEKGEFLAAYNWSDKKEDRDKVLKKLIEQDEASKIRALPEFINTAYALIDKRTIQQNALDDAIQIFSAVIIACKNNPNSNEKITDCMVSAVGGSLVCANHAGDKDHQNQAINIYNKYISYISTIPYFTRQEKMLSIRTRAYNQQFNSYDFQSIIDDFELVVKDRIANMPKDNKDSLTGEMLGTIGQAYAFQSSGNAEYAKYAEKYFRDSMYHFVPGHIYHQMSVNYLATLKWFQNDLQGTKDAFAIHKHIDSNGTVEQWLKVELASQEGHLGTAFNVSVLLRLAVSNGTVTRTILDDIEVLLEKNKISQHPYELIYKWLGVAYLNRGQHDEAINTFNKSIALSYANGFTLQTISISTLGLKCIALIRKSESFSTKFEILTERINTLNGRSAYFGKYIDSIGGTEKMYNDICNQDINAVSKWMPFAYA